MFLNHLKLPTKKNPEDVSLSDKSVFKLQSLAKQKIHHFEESFKTSSENMAGDLQSKIRGAGVDFEENKPYEPGSDSRAINWRTFARTQQLFVNIYNEDKRPSTYIMLDQRSNMYFGTRRQLKIKQALTVALYFVFRAMYKQENVSGVQILNKPKWHTIHSGTSAISTFSRMLNTPIFPAFNKSREPDLNQVINKLKLTSGSELVVISDFHDMNEDTITALYSISKNNNINLTQIQDPVEVNIPGRGSIKIRNKFSDPVLTLNCSKTLQNKYYSLNQKRFLQYKQQCMNMGIMFNQHLTTDTIFDV